MVFALVPTGMSTEPAETLSEFELFLIIDVFWIELTVLIAASPISSVSLTIFLELLTT